MISWWRSRTLCFRLAVWYGAGGTLLVALFAATLYGYVAERLGRPIGQALRADFAAVQQRLGVRADGVITWNGADLRGGLRPNEYPWFELWDENGRLVRRVWPFSARRIVEHPQPPVRRGETISIFYVAQDVRVRTLTAPLGGTGRAAGWMLRVMRLHEPNTDALDDLRWIIVIALPAVIALLVGGGFLVTRRWLLPLIAMVAEARRITAADRERRLPVANSRDELGQLACVFNETLDRLQAAIDALDRFVGDASHELRTPLATLRSVGEVGLRCSGSLEESNQTIRSMLEEAERLELLTRRLLDLARAEGGPAIAARSLVAAERCVSSVVDELRPRAEAKSQQLEIEATPCQLETDAVLFRQALLNLVDNAIKHSPAGSRITVRMTASEADLEVAVVDDGPGIAPEHRAALMQRFYRPNRGRDRASGGHGLGLSIAKAFMRVLGGALHYTPGEPRGSVFRLVLPRAARA